MSRKWTEEDKEKLQRLIDKGYSMKQLAEALDRTYNAIKRYVTKHNIEVKNRKCYWTEEKERELAEDWKDPDVSKTMLARKYHTSFKAIKQKAWKMGLGGRTVSDEYMTEKELAELTGAGETRIKTWVKLGLPVHRTKGYKTNRTKYLYSVDELLEFFEGHLDAFDGSLIDRAQLYYIPDWLEQKIRQDFAKRNGSRSDREWTTLEDSRLKGLFYRGLTDAELAKEMRRSKGAIHSRRNRLGLKRDGGHYTDEEIAIIKKYASTCTATEISLKYLRNRRADSISHVCKRLGIKIVDGRYVQR